MSRLQAGFANFRHLEGPADTCVGQRRSVTKVEHAMAEVLP